MKSGNLNFLETSGPIQACNGTDFYNSMYVLRITCYRSAILLGISIKLYVSQTYSLEGFKTMFQKQWIIEKHGHIGRIREKEYRSTIEQNKDKQFHRYGILFIVKTRLWIQNCAVYRLNNSDLRYRTLRMKHEAVEGKSRVKFIL